jgi:gas vesicle protein
MFHTKRSYTDFIEGMLIGGSFGAVAAFIFGTQKGKKLQKDMLHKYRTFKHKVEHLGEQIQKSPKAKKFKKAAKKVIKNGPAVKPARKKSARKKKRHVAR